MNNQNICSLNQSSFKLTMEISDLHVFNKQTVKTQAVLETMARKLLSSKDMKISNILMSTQVCNVCADRMMVI